LTASSISVNANRPHLSLLLLLAQVAIKLIRSNETMFKAAQTEVQVLKLLASTDPDNHKNCIRMLRHFEYRNHACLVFEPMVRLILEERFRVILASW
jgi:hypothetical protein